MNKIHWTNNAGFTSRAFAEHKNSIPCDLVGNTLSVDLYV